MPKQRKVSPEREAARKALRETSLRLFAANVIPETRNRLRECGLSDVWEPPAEFDAAECRLMLQALDRLEARYKFLWEIAKGTDEGARVLALSETCFGVPGALDPVRNWGRV